MFRKYTLEMMMGLLVILIFLLKFFLRMNIIAFIIIKAHFEKTNFLYINVYLQIGKI